MSKDEINACPIKQWDGPIFIVDSKDKLTQALDLLARESLLGFDTETRPAYKKGQYYLPSLLQLAGSKEAFLFQLGRIGLPQSLAALLEDTNVTKVGVSIDQDLRELQKLHRFKPAGFVELAKLSKKNGIKNHGLRGLAAVLLGIRIPKTAQRSNWARENLKPAQIRYAATDAWIGRQLFLELANLP